MALLLDRHGRVEYVIAGDQSQIVIPSLNRARAGSGRLRGLRLIHTHLKNEALSKEDLTDLAMLRLDMVVAIVTGADGMPVVSYAAHLNPGSVEKEPWTILEPRRYPDFGGGFRELISALENDFARKDTRKEEKGGALRATMAHISNLPRGEAMRRLDELSELARTEGIIAVDRVMFRGDPNPQSLLGSGRVKDLVVRSLAAGADMILFDQELTPSQARWVGAITDMPILDRTQLILRIFGRRAHSADGKLRVELARLKYALPRLGLKDDALSRIRGGIGMKGPGETSMEISRRRIKDKIIGIQDNLERLGHGREQRRSQRKKSGAPQIAVIGYTNAGKSTLLNALTGSDALVEDKLFATLDPMSRRIRRPRKLDVILSDTVGFISDLPDDLLAAFRSTLEELRDADLLIHLADISAPDFENAMKAVVDLLERIGLDKIPRKVVLNKIDTTTTDMVENIAARYEAIPISATTGEGLNRLLDEVETALNMPKKAYGYDESFEENDAE
jgi:GTP-binding protein HflX